ncbi:MAG: LmbE family protein [Bacteroidetes bacterium GWF2_33_38]|nr:MAG: LmbE family protein [Bacteroidetes bacterium GWF2_33_38]OFY73216.1 MAG: LmbE family protein [Bacteroidetes bacterium RIFOXYA12_FULL_33_9]OFY88666.1 MAG: LmbE family protein [Bacteroidetes bacterium RIFOXYA2_FULL_33_7]
MIRNKKIIVLAPHTDDGEIGAGGSIARFIEEGSEVYYVAFSTADQSLPKEFSKGTLAIEVKRATRVLGIKPENLIIFDFEVRKLNFFRQDILEKMVQLKKDINPDIILMPSLHDIHQDHSTIANEGLRAFKDKTILGYELIWNNLTFDTTSFVKLKQHHVQQKCNAIKEYKTQSTKEYVKENLIYSQAQTRGLQIGCNYAEAFEVIRLVIDF